jgi:hypothetical protein
MKVPKYYQIGLDMAKDLTNSLIDRQNILNNRHALIEIKNNLDLGGINYDKDIFFTKHHLTKLFKISDTTVERYIKAHSEELKKNGYLLLKGIQLKNFKKSISSDFIEDISKTTVLGIFNFRAMLNFAMLLTESEQAKLVRSRILDIVIQVITEKSGGHTKFINQRDTDYFPSFSQEYSYRKKFTKALSDYLEMGNYKYAVYTNKIYQLIFKENANEYKQILKLTSKDKVRETLYSEVLKAIASVESGLAEDIKLRSTNIKRKLKPHELDEMLEELNNNHYLTPIIEDARTKMASRDMSFRDVLHTKLKAYLKEVPEDDVEKFLGDASRSLEEQLKDPEILAVFQRLKDK